MVGKGADFALGEACRHLGKRLQGGSAVAFGEEIAGLGGIGVEDAGVAAPV